MPYISAQSRLELETRCPETAGELNYEFTQLILEYLGENYNYQKFNDVMGALEGCKHEMYRRLVGNYENKKIYENGDVYPVQDGEAK